MPVIGGGVCGGIGVDFVIDVGNRELVSLDVLVEP
jgi:hypothetical protein